MNGQHQGRIEVVNRHAGLQLSRYLVLAFCLASSAALAECLNTPINADLTSFYSNSWGIDHRNTRYQPASSLNAENAANLELKWAYGLAHETPRSFPLVTKDTIFIGDSNHGLLALERETGCERWVYEHDGLITSAIIPGNIRRAKAKDQPILVFADRFSGVYAVDAQTGQLVWHITLQDHLVPLYSGTPLVTNDTVFVPISSLEVGLAVNPFYGCCTTSGGMAAFDINTGEKKWYLPTIEEAAKVRGSHFGFVDEWGPSGAPVWGAPTYDSKRNWLFFGTGQNYSHPTTDTSDAIFAVDAASGEVQWVKQFTANDAFNAACTVSLNHPNCAQPTGPDVDFGAPTLLAHTPDGKDILLAGQKSGDVHAMNPDTGELLWSRKLGRGGIIGGVHWGLAVNESTGTVFVPINDRSAMNYPSPGTPTPGLYALDIESGEPLWQFSRNSRCDDEQCMYGLSSAITATNDIVITASMDGYLEVINAADGKLLWSHDSWKTYESVNGVTVKGGSFDTHGPMIADDQVMVSSGYRYISNQRGGNAFLVFQVVTPDD
jgi:polyvinyl alcohol dehydrogenase (cytochrome)|tara:strand:+ start:280 stop:1923 length:1644 start_codon:yes stop_codon:yes gene_type:complete